MLNVSQSTIIDNKCLMSSVNQCVKNIHANFCDDVKFSIDVSTKYII